MNKKNTKRILLALLLSSLFFVNGAKAETGVFNIHLDIGPTFALTGWQAAQLGVGMSAQGRFEWAAFSWLGFEAGAGWMQFFKGQHPEGYVQMDKAYLFTANGGARFRILNDEEGYLFPWKKTPGHTGNWWGNLWADIHGDFIQTGDVSTFGVDVGVGASVSLVNGLQVGPFVRGLFVYGPNTANKRNSQDAWLMLAGLNFSAAIPFKGRTMKDSDGDGIFDPHDQCVKEEEDKDGFQDADGCPEMDNDDDRIPDDIDDCPDQPEDRDGFEDEDGCPDKDNDGDGVNDSNDRCPTITEDLDEFEDSDGCPDLDNDEDSILDEDDQCPNEAELKNGIEDDDGCPEPDRDSDGFVDSVDKCPDEPETINGVKDDDGCPDKAMVEVKEGRIVLEKRIFFETGMVRIKSDSKKMLGQLVNLITAHPEYVKISIEGHADSNGSVELNRKLSLRRAGQVRKYLIKNGVDANRLEVKGFGEKEPWKQGRGKEARTKNRRVEFVIEIIDTNLALNPVAPGTVEDNPYE